MNLKEVMMELGNKLVIKHRFTPTRMPITAAEADRSTEHIQRFTEWVNRTPEAREALHEMGVEWPIVPIPHPPEEEKPRRMCQP